MRRLLRDRPDEASECAGAEIAHRLEGTAAWARASTVALYASLPGEVATDALISSAWRGGKRVLLPRVVGEGQLAFAEHPPAASLVAGAFGVLEPPPTEPSVDLVEADLVLVPGLAFDRHGGRLGRGRGYYDRALATLGRSGVREVATERDPAVPRAIGVAFDLQLVETVPMDVRDVRLEAVVTPSAMYIVDRPAT